MAGSLSFSSVLVNYNDTIVENLDLQKVVDAMRSNKTLPKTFKALAKVAKDRKDANMFLRALKDHLDLFGFSVFLETLQSLAVQGDEGHQRILALLCVNLPYLTLPAEPRSEADAFAVEVIRRIIRTYLVPDYIIGKTESKVFTSSGGTFYSETHGVAINISEEAMCGIPNFSLSMNASLHGPYQFPPNVEICSPIISLTCEPPIKEFSNFVQIEIPHCASELSDPELFCVLTAQEEDQKMGIYHFHEDPTELIIDLSSQFYFTVRTNHFCKKTIGKRPRRRILSTSKRKIHRLLEKQKRAASLKSKRTTSFDEASGSTPTAQPVFAHSTSAPAGYASATAFDEPQSMECWITMCSPEDKSSETWRNVFFVSQFLPTGMAEIENAAMKYFKCDVSELDLDSCCFSFKAPRIYFTPESWNTEGWSGKVWSSPAVIEKDKLLRQAGEDVPMNATFLGCFPLKVVYRVQVDRSCQPEPIEISVEGATRCDEPVALTVFPPSVSQPTTNRCIHVTVGLYSDESLLCQSLVSPRPDYVFQLDDLDTMKFLSEISLQLSTVWRELASILGISSSDIANLEAFASHGERLQREACFLMLYDKWLKEQEATLGKLLQSLQRLHREVKLSWHFRKKYQTSFTEVAIHDHDLFLKLTTKIASQWKFIARLLGMAESEVENIDCVPSADHRDLVEKATGMLRRWKMSLSVHATYLSLCNSIRVVNQYTSTLTDAVMFIQNHPCISICII